MKKVLALIVFAVVFSIIFPPAPSYCKSMTTPNGDVYESACGRIKIAADIYYWASELNRMLYVGRVVDVVRVGKQTIVWLQMPRSMRAEPRLRKAICDWGWVKVKEANK
jgi:hypothetical protein